MKVKIFTSFLIFTLILFFPQVSAESEELTGVNQKPVELTIDLEGNVHVVHQIRDSNELKKLNFINGTVSNLKFKDSVGREISAENLPGQGKLSVEYDLKDFLILKR